MEEKMPVVPKVESITCHTGNIVNWNRLKKRMRQTSTAELTECMKDNISSWLEKSDLNELQSISDIHCFNEKFMQKVTEFPEKRDELKITAKLFLNILDVESISEAMKYLTQELGTNYIETVILSLPESKHSLEHIKPLYQKLEDILAQEQVFSLGLADLNKETLEDVYNWAATKPMMNQVNLAHCCVIPPELTEFAKLNNIQLLTHSDDKEILPDKVLEEILSDTFSPRDAERWQTSWVIRYSVIIKQRGVIKTKGYVACAKRHSKLSKQ